MTDQEALKLYLSKPTISVPEAGKILGIGRSQAYAAAKRGEIPVLKFGNLLRVPSMALSKMLSLEDYT